MGVEKITLTYFNLKGRGEVARNLLKIAKVDFVDKRIELADWKDLKEKTPFGQVPVLELPCGTILSQMVGIEYYLSQKYGFLGDDVIDQARALMVTGCVEDCLTRLYAMFKMSPEDKEKARLELENTELVESLKKLMNVYKSNKLNSGFFIGKKVTLADLKFCSIFNYTEMHNIKYDLSPFPELKALKENVDKMLK